MRAFRFAFFIPALLCATGVIADANTPTSKGNNVTISGTVVDENGDTLPQATIVVVGSDIHTVADNDGNFTITPSGLDDILEFRFVGFEPVTISVADAQNNPKIVLTGTNTLDEVTTAGCKNLDEEIDSETGKCVKIKPEKPAVEPVVATEPPTPAPKPTPKELEEKLKSAKDALAAAKEKENSLANKSLSAISTAATSLGAMQLAEGIAEKKADEKAEKEMRNYISTMKCEYGGGQEAVFGNEEITLPGGNELLEYYTEYKTLADNLKTTKAALGLRAGIETEVLYDRAQSGLYQYSNVGKTGGGETSLYRALTDTESADATAWSEQKETASKKLKVGAVATAVGVGGGIIGNYLINERGKNDTDETDIDKIAARAGNALGQNRNNTEQLNRTDPTNKPSDKKAPAALLEQKKSCDDIIKDMQEAACNSKGVEFYDYSGHVELECLDKVYIACDELKDLRCSNSNLSPIATTNYGYSVGQSNTRANNNGFWCTFKRDRDNVAPGNNQSNLTEYQKQVRAKYDKYNIACGPNGTRQIELLAQDDHRSDIYKKLEQDCRNAGGDILIMAQDKKSTGTVIYNCRSLECD